MHSCSALSCNRLDRGGREVGTGTFQEHSCSAWSWNRTDRGGREVGTGTFQKHSLHTQIITGTSIITIDVYFGKITL